MEDPIYKLRFLLSWSYATCALVILYVLIRAFFYFHLVWSYIALDAYPTSVAWHSAIPYMSDFYYNIFLSLILITSRALDFTTTKSQIKFFYFMLVLLFLNIITGFNYFNDVRHGEDILFIMFPLELLLSFVLCCIGFGMGAMQYEYAGNKKIALAQILLSVSVKIFIWMPIILIISNASSYQANHEYRPWVGFSLLYVATVIVFSVLVHVYYVRHNATAGAAAELNISQNAQ